MPPAGARTRTAALPDGARQVAVAVSATLAVAGAVLGSGAVVGTPVSEAAGGALATDATLVAPAGPAFSIWSVIYAGLVAVAVLQLLPSRRTDPRQRDVGWLVALSMLLNAGWILTIQAGRLAASVLVIAALLVTLVGVCLRLRRSRPASRVEAVVLDVTMGLYLGWVAIATVANVAAGLAAGGVDDLVVGAEVWAVLVLVGAGAVGVALVLVGGGGIPAAAALSWGLVWVAVARTTGEPVSRPTAVTAVLAAAVVLGLALVVAARRRPSPA
jgi:hypothetical protein